MRNAYAIEPSSASVAVGKRCTSQTSERVPAVESKLLKRDWPKSADHCTKSIKISVISRSTSARTQHDTRHKTLEGRCTSTQCEMQFGQTLAMVKDTHRYRDDRPSQWQTCSAPTNPTRHSCCQIKVNSPTPTAAMQYAKQCNSNQLNPTCCCWLKC